MYFEIMIEYSTAPLIDGVERLAIQLEDEMVKGILLLQERYYNKVKKTKRLPNLLKFSEWDGEAEGVKLHTVNCVDGEGENAKVKTIHYITIVTRDAVYNRWELVSALMRGKVTVNQLIRAIKMLHEDVNVHPKCVMMYEKDNPTFFPNRVVSQF